MDLRRYRPNVYYQEASWTTTNAPMTFMANANRVSADNCRACTNCLPATNAAAAGTRVRSRCDCRRSACWNVNSDCI